MYYVPVPATLRQDEGATRIPTAGRGSWSWVSKKLAACDLRFASLLPQPLAQDRRHTADGTERHGKFCRKTFTRFTPATAAASCNVKFAALPSHSRSPKRARVWSRDLSLSMKWLLDIPLLFCEKKKATLWKPSVMRNWLPSTRNID